MGKRIGKYKISNKESTISLVDGGISTVGIKARGYATKKPSLLQKWPAHTSIGATSNQTLTIAQLLTGVIEEDPEGATLTERRAEDAGATR